MRRRAGVLLPIEMEILLAACAAAATGDGWVHGFALAKLLRDARGSARLTAHGTLYKALGRLSERRLLEDRWEDPAIALADGRPRRRLYRISLAGQRALANAPADAPGPTAPATPRIAPA